MSNLTIIIILAVVIIVMSIIAAFGKAVGAGANVSDLFPEGVDKNKTQEPAQAGRKNKTFRIIGGILFGILMLCPIMYKHRASGVPFINMNHLLRDYLVGFLIVSDLVVFVIIWFVDRKQQK
ncbi:hypothetical protein [Geobacter sp. AOG2]|uniref:hypothetical protein n=1 Tax=Geobacter sp. AOG2 TaxID=1566347 RepID=UPI001CC4C3E6|nr:hypothetical protein [Geobacter sp. AOG2]